MNNKGKIGLYIALAVVVWHLLGAVIIGVTKNSIEVDTSDVWNMTDRAVSVVTSLTRELKSFEKDRLEVTALITEARQSRDLDKLDKAMVAVNALVENYPATDLSQQQIALMDETAGSLSRIAHARRILFDDKKLVNDALIIFPLCNLVFSREYIPNSDFNAGQAMPVLGGGE